MGDENINQGIEVNCSSENTFASSIKDGSPVHDLSNKLKILNLGTSSKRKNAIHNFLTSPLHSIENFNSESKTPDVFASGFDSLHETVINTIENEGATSKTFHNTSNILDMISDLDSEFKSTIDMFLETTTKPSSCKRSLSDLESLMGGVTNSVTENHDEISSANFKSKIGFSMNGNCVDGNAPPLKDLNTWEHILDHHSSSSNESVWMSQKESYQQNELISTQTTTCIDESSGQLVLKIATPYKTKTIPLHRLNSEESDFTVKRDMLIKSDKKLYKKKEDDIKVRKGKSLMNDMDEAFKSVNTNPEPEGSLVAPKFIQDESEKDMKVTNGISEEKIYPEDNNSENFSECMLSKDPKVEDNGNLFHEESIYIESCHKDFKDMSESSKKNIEISPVESLNKIDFSGESFDADTLNAKPNKLSTNEDQKNVSRNLTFGVETNMEKTEKVELKKQVKFTMIDQIHQLSLSSESDSSSLEDTEKIAVKNNCIEIPKELPSERSQLSSETGLYNNQETSMLNEQTCLNSTFTTEMKEQLLDEVIIHHVITEENTVSLRISPNKHSTPDNKQDSIVKSDDSRVENTSSEDVSEDSSNSSFTVASSKYMPIISKGKISIVETVKYRVPPISETMSITEEDLEFETQCHTDLKFVGSDSTTENPVTEVKNAASPMNEICTDFIPDENKINEIQTNSTIQKPINEVQEEDTPVNETFTYSVLDENKIAARENVDETQIISTVNESINEMQNITLPISEISTDFLLDENKISIQDEVKGTSQTRLIVEEPVLQIISTDKTFAKNDNTDEIQIHSTTEMLVDQTQNLDAPKNETFIDLALEKEYISIQNETISTQITSIAEKTINEIQKISTSTDETHTDLELGENKIAIQDGSNETNIQLTTETLNNEVKNSPASVNEACTSFVSTENETAIQDKTNESQTNLSIEKVADQAQNTDVSMDETFIDLVSDEKIVVQYECKKLETSLVPEKPVSEVEDIIKLIDKAVVNFMPYEKETDILDEDNKIQIHLTPEKSVNKVENMADLRLDENEISVNDESNKILRRSTIEKFTNEMQNSAASIDETSTCLLSNEKTKENESNLTVEKSVYEAHIDEIEKEIFTNFLQKEIESFIQNKANEITTNFTTNEVQDIDTFLEEAAFDSKLEINEPAVQNRTNKTPEVHGLNHLEVTSTETANVMKINDISDGEQVKITNEFVDEVETKHLIHEESSISESRLKQCNSAPVEIESIVEDLNNEKKSATQNEIIEIRINDVPLDQQNHNEITLEKAHDIEIATAERHEEYISESADEVTATHLENGNPDILLSSKTRTEYSNNFEKYTETQLITKKSIIEIQNTDAGRDEEYPISIINEDETTTLDTAIEVRTNETIILEASSLQVVGATTVINSLTNEHDENSETLEQADVNEVSSSPQIKIDTENIENDLCNSKFKENDNEMKNVQIKIETENIGNDLCNSKFEKNDNEIQNVDESKTGFENEANETRIINIVENKTDLIESEKTECEMEVTCTLADKYVEVTHESLNETSEIMDTEVDNELVRETDTTIECSIIEDTSAKIISTIPASNNSFNVKSPSSTSINNVEKSVEVKAEICEKLIQKQNSGSEKILARSASPFEDLIKDVDDIGSVFSDDEYLSADEKCDSVLVSEDTAEIMDIPIKQENASDSIKSVGVDSTPTSKNMYQEINTAVEPTLNKCQEINNQTISPLRVHSVQVDRKLNDVFKEVTEDGTSENQKTLLQPSKSMFKSIETDLLSPQAIAQTPHSVLHTPKIPSSLQNDAKHFSKAALVRENLNKLLTPFREKISRLCTPKNTSCSKNINATPLFICEETEDCNKTRFVVELPTNLLDISVAALDNMLMKELTADEMVQAEEKIKQPPVANETQTEMIEDLMKQLICEKKKNEELAEENDKLKSLCSTLYENEQELKRALEKYEDNVRILSNRYEMLKDYANKYVCQLNEEREKLENELQAIRKN